MNKIIYLEHGDIGATLTTWIYCYMNQMWAAEQSARDVYVNWCDDPSRSLQGYYDAQKFQEIKNMHQWYFVQPKISEPPPREDCEVWLWSENSGNVPVHLIAQPLAVIKDYYKKHLHFNDVVNQRGEALAAKYNIDFSNTIGITWRGTDASTDGRIRLPIETYFPFIDDILANYPSARIMCTAEETKVLAPLLLRYQQAFTIEEFYSSPYGDKRNPERFSPLSGFERGMQPALMVWLFSKCAWYIKNRSSTGAVASWLSSGKIINLCHEETLSYLKMDDQVEIEGVKYPLNRSL